MSWLVRGVVDKQVRGTPVKEPRTGEPRNETWFLRRRRLLRPRSGGGWRSCRGGSGSGCRGGAWSSGGGDGDCWRGGCLEVEHVGGFAVVDEVDVWPQEGELVAVRGDVSEARHIHVRARGQADVVDGRVGDGDREARLLENGEESDIDCVCVCVWYESEW